jgi:8-oxo-dGTP diphosphatase
LHPEAASDAANVRRFAVDALPSLAFDHADIIAMARLRLWARLDGSIDAFGFLPRTFTMDELRTLQEIVGGKRLDPRSFRRRVLALELIENTGKTRAVGGRPAWLYRPRRPMSARPAAMP